MIYNFNIPKIKQKKICSVEGENSMHEHIERLKEYRIFQYDRRKHTEKEITAKEALKILNDNYSGLKWIVDSLIHAQSLLTCNSIFRAIRMQ